MSKQMIAAGRIPERGTTPGNAVALLRDLLYALDNREEDGAEVYGYVRRAFHAMTGEYPEPEQVRAILAPEN